MNHNGTRFLPDAPSRRDALGPHASLASSVLTALSQDAIRAVALEGGWGTGKSTVVALLCDALEKDSNVCVVHFDAWKHQGDPVRRSILESMLRATCARGWVPKDLADSAVLRLRRLTKTTTTTRHPELTANAAIALGLVAMSPIGNALVAAALRDGISFAPHPGYSVSWRFVVGAVLSLAPVVGAVGVMLSHLARGGNDPLGALKLLSTQSKDITASTSVEAVEVSAIEFAEECDQLLGAVDRRERSVVVVVDNLERTPPADALAIWSAIHSMVSAEQFAPLSAHRRVKFVVPFDPEAVKPALESKSVEDASVDEFLDKLFDLRLEVPRPILQKWREYLLLKLAEALPGEAPSDREAVASMYGSMVPLESPPSPRDIVRLVNNIVALRVRCGAVIGLRHLAYYVLLRRKMRFEQVANGLLSSGLPLPEHRRFLDADAHSNLCALLFQVAPEDGVHILLNDPLARALAGGSAPELDKLSGVPGFGAFAMRFSWPPETAQLDATVANAAKAIAQSGLRNANAQAAKALVAGLARRVQTSSKWIGLNEASAPGVGDLVRLSESLEVTRDVIRVLNGTNPGAVDSPDDTADCSLAGWTAAAISVGSAVSELRKSDAARASSGKIELARLGLERLVRVLAVLRSVPRSASVADHFYLSDDGDGSAAEVGPYFASGRATSDVWRAMAVKPDFAATLSTAGASQHIIERLTSNQALGSRELAAMFGALCALRAYPESSTESARSYLSTDDIYQWIYVKTDAERVPGSEDAGASDDEQAFGALVAAVTAYGQGWPPVRQGGSILLNGRREERARLETILSEPDLHPEAIGMHAELAESAGMMPTLLESSTAQVVGRDWVRAVARRCLARRGKLDGIVGVDVAVENWEALEAICGDELSGVLDAWVGMHAEDLLKQLPGHALASSRTGLVRRLREAGVRVEELANVLEAEIGAHPTEMYQSVLRGEAPELLAGVRMLGQLKRAARPPVALRDAISDVALAVARGEAVTLNREAVLTSIAVVEDGGDGDQLGKQLYDGLRESVGSGREEFFNLFGEACKKPGVLGRQPLIENEIFRPIVDGGHACELEWLRSCAELGALESVSASDRSALIDRLENRSTGDAVSQRMIEGLLSVLKKP